MHALSEFCGMARPLGLKKKRKRQICLNLNQLILNNYYLGKLGNSIKKSIKDIPTEFSLTPYK